MKTCMFCGRELADASKFCDGCGAAQPEQPANTVAPAAPPPYTPPFPPPYNPYAPPYYPAAAPPRVKKRGKGFGITAMILSIAGLYMSFVFFLITVIRDTGVLSSYGDFEGFAQSRSQIFLGGFVYAAAALVFGIVALKKGYKNRVSLSGVIMAGISIAFLLAAFAISFAKTAI